MLARIPAAVTILGALAYVTGCTPAPGELPILEIASDATFPPFHYIDDAGVPTGFDIELARLIAARAGLQPVVEVRLYDELFTGLADNTHDLVAATTGITSERQERYLFTDPYFETCQAALVRIGGDEPTSLADLAGRRVGASGAGTAARAMRTVTGAEHVPLDVEGVSPLLDGVVDAIIVDEFDAVEMARASEGRLRVLAEPVARESYAFVLARGRDDLKRELDHALRELTEEGEVAALRARFGVARDTEWPVHLESPAHWITQGVAQERGPCTVTLECRGGGNIREALCGESTADDGRVWAVPSPITDGQTLVDVYNECTGGGANPDYEAELETQIIDDSDGGVEITAHLFGDNYFELYANGEYVGRDAVAFTPFNSHAARIRVTYPVTYAVLLVDWEGYLGVGLEETRERFHIGDGGFIATFSDNTATDETWKCKVFYVAPLDDAGCVAFDARGNADSSSCPSEDATVSCIDNDPTTTCRALHVPLPDDWMAPELDDSGWLAATTYTADEVTGSPAFRDYEDTLFRGAEFIWTSNLDLDNQVVCRKTVQSAP